jgi:hypothetical protein
MFFCALSRRLDKAGPQLLDQVEILFTLRNESAKHDSIAKKSASREVHNTRQCSLDIPGGQAAVISIILFIVDPIRIMSSIKSILQQNV